MDSSWDFEYQCSFLRPTERRRYVPQIIGEMSCSPPTTPTPTTKLRPLHFASIHSYSMQLYGGLDCITGSGHILQDSVRAGVYLHSHVCGGFAGHVHQPKRHIPREGAKDKNRSLAEICFQPLQKKCPWFFTFRCNTPPSLLRCWYSYLICASCKGHSRCQVNRGYCCRLLP